MKNYNELGKSMVLNMKLKVYYEDNPFPSEKATKQEISDFLDKEIKFLKSLNTEEV